MLMIEKCKHKLPNGESAVLWDTTRWFGIHPQKIIGVCSLCRKCFKITKEEYMLKYKKGGEG